MKRVLDLMIDQGVDGICILANFSEQFLISDGERAAAFDGYARILPAVNHENRQCGFRSDKAAMVAGGVIKSAFCRHPIVPLPPATESMLMDLIRPLDPLVLNWGK